MRRLVFLFVISTTAFAQQPTLKAAAKVPHTSPYFNASDINFRALMPPPPAAASNAGRADMDAVLRAQRSRTPAQVADAQRDDREEDIFVFSTVLGPHFNAAELPATAKLSVGLHQAASAVDPALKNYYRRPRPYNASKDVHPVCALSKSESYPSGHSMSATLEALALTQIVPEQSTAILERLNDYLHNRVVCGVHYPSDAEASRMFSTALFGLISASPTFQADLASARNEVRQHLALDEKKSVAATAAR